MSCQSNCNTFCGNKWQLDIGNVTDIGSGDMRFNRAASLDIKVPTRVTRLSLRRQRRVLFLSM